MTTKRAHGVRANRSPQLVVSFWHIGLENLPESRFHHQSVTAKKAKQLIDKARTARTLQGVSEDDIFAPYHKQEKDNHTKLCRVLDEHYGIRLSLKDFVMNLEDGGRPSYSIRPLQFATVTRSSRLLVVSCHYVMTERRKKGRLEFDIAPDSVTFHLFESIGSPSIRRVVAVARLRRDESSRSSGLTDPTASRTLESSGMTKLSDVTLSDEAARFIAAEVAAGRFRSVDDALQAGVDALKERDEVERDWLQHARERFAEGRAAFARGEVLETTPDELMDGIDKELGLA